MYSPPKVLKMMFPKSIWNSKSDKILLTFDDGPNPETTDMILEELEKQNIKALFFCVGENAVDNPKLIESIANEGHTIGNHTHSHQNIMLKSKSVIDRQIKVCSNALFDITGERTKYFRPPHGKFDHRTNYFMKSHQLTNVMWSLLTYDYKNDLNIVKFAVQNYLTKNSIIVLHDSIKSKNIIRSSIETIAEIASTKSYEFGEPSECLK